MQTRPHEFWPALASRWTPASSQQVFDRRSIDRRSYSSTRDETLRPGYILVVGNTTRLYMSVGEIRVRMSSSILIPHPTVRNYCDLTSTALVQAQAATITPMRRCCLSGRATCHECAARARANASCPSRSFLSTKDSALLVVGSGRTSRCPTASHWRRGRRIRTCDDEDRAPCAPPTSQGLMVDPHGPQILAYSRRPQA